MAVFTTYWPGGYWDPFYWLPLYWPVLYEDGCAPDSEYERLYENLMAMGKRVDIDALATYTAWDAEIEGETLGVTARAYGDVEVVVATC